MKKKLFLATIFSFLVLSTLFPVKSLAQTESQAQENPYQQIVPDEEPSEQTFRAKVLEVIEQGEYELGGNIQAFQKLKVEITTGTEKGKQVEINDEGAKSVIDARRAEVGDILVIGKISSFGQDQYFINDRYRLPWVLAIVGLFFAITIIFGRLKGLSSILGLALSILILSQFIVPQILAGHDPLLITLAGSCMIVFASLYLAHGFNRQTSLAVGSTVVTLLISIGLAALFVKLALLFGTGAEETIYLQLGPTANLNLRGLLLGGIIIGTLGVLDDITTGQTAAVYQIRRANPKLPFIELYKRGTAIGREHIASLVNTLVLAYAGSSLPLFILFSMNVGQPLWAVLNSEFISEEIVRTLVGSMALIIAVPIATFVAAYFFSRWPIVEEDGVYDSHGHSH